MPTKTMTLARVYKLWPKWRTVFGSKKKKPKPGNPARIHPHHRNAPTSHPLPAAKKPKKPTSLPNKIVNLCHDSLAAAGKMTYTEGAGRSQLFHRAVGAFAGSAADCSQYCSSILHWLGVKSVTDTDYTGTLLEKGKRVAEPAAGLVAIWGPGTGAHAAFITEKTPDGHDWYVVGFGHQGAPDRNTLTGMNAYFVSVGEPGVRYLKFA